MTRKEMIAEATKWSNGGDQAHKNGDEDAANAMWSKAETIWESLKPE